MMEKTGSAESWTWQKTGADGSIEARSTESHSNYGDVVYDALRHGFHPKQQPWVVTDGGITSHYFPDGTPPQSGGSTRAASSPPDSAGD